MPPYPRGIAYLYEWARELHGRSGVGMSGLLPLTYATVFHWSQLTKQSPAPHEVLALFELDALMLHPPEPAAP